MSEHPTPGAPSTDAFGPDLLVDDDRAAELKAASHDWPSWDLDDRQLCDLELLANGAFAPLAGYLDEADHAEVVARMRLADGTTWPVPTSLEVDERLAAAVGPGDHVALRDPEGTMLAALAVSSTFRPTVGPSAGRPCLGGTVEAVQLPNQYDFTHLRHTPAETRGLFDPGDQRAVVAVTTWQPLLTADLDHLRDVAADLDATVLVQAVGGDAPAAPMDRFSLVRSLQAATDELPAEAVLNLVPLAARADEPVRQAVLEALVARAHGATHVLAPADPDAAAELADHADELGVEVVARPDTAGTTLSQVQDLLTRDAPVPDGVVPPAVLDELVRAVPPRHQRGFTVFFTGLSGSGKSTVANIVATRLREAGGRRVSLLDGDLVRRHLSSELGFSREHRNLNVLRIGYVASEVTKHGGVAVCAPIAPYDDIRRQNRERIEATGGGYVLVHVATPLEVCEARDRKGLYAKARDGIITEFTGVSDPYEEPTDAEVTLDTTDISPTEAAEQVLDHLRAAGWLAP